MKIAPMDLTAGTRLDHYEISGPLGAGGMGEGYRARDTKLEREVALKILPEQFASDPERLARFEREAKVLASLNHANIAAIYGLGHATGVPGAGASGVRFLVLELVEGPTLAERLNSERGARVSSSGRYFSYTSNETGIDQAFVRPFDGEAISSAGGQWMISPSGGASPKWRDDELEMFYHSPDGTIMSVEITTDPTFRPLGTPTPLFEGPAGVLFWDVTGDGQQFLIPAPPTLTSQTPYRVILNWTATIER